jgi:hypothetical protein
MYSGNLIEKAAVAGALIIGGILFVWSVMLSDSVPEEYRSASPGFGWSWSFNYEEAMRDAGKFGAEPWPWPAKETGNRLVLPLNQPLLSKGIVLVFRGKVPSGKFKMDVVINRLDPNVSYPRIFSVPEAKRGFTIGGRQFRLEKITPHYLRLSSVDK